MLSLKALQLLLVKDGIESRLSVFTAPFDPLRRPEFDTSDTIFRFVYCFPLVKFLNKALNVVSNETHLSMGIPCGVFLIVGVILDMKRSLDLCRIAEGDNPPCCFA
jgi:hypothetical protein